MEVIARPQNHDAASIKAYYDRHVKGKGGGEAIHKTVSSAPAHRGRFGGDLLNRNKDSTGLTYDRKTADDITRDAAVDDVAESLTKGHAVPLIVGQADGETAHYVLALTVHPGPPKTFFIHDPASGTTVTRTEAQMKKQGQLRADLTGLDAFAVAVQLEEAAASPDELTATFEALRQVLQQSESSGQPAPRRYKASLREALEVTSRVLAVPNNIKIRGWLNNECAPFIKTESDIKAFMEFFQAVVRQYVALRAVSAPKDDI